jgi:hypothetical protein
MWLSRFLTVRRMTSTVPATDGPAHPEPFPEPPETSPGRS